jgi:bacterioferritin-associated ferredoxin
MFVCICNGITERQIRDAVSDGACSLDELGARLGVASGCGTCQEFARQVLHETLQQSTAAGQLLTAA